jgi:hypothetical protein
MLFRRRFSDIFQQKPLSFASMANGPGKTAALESSYSGGYNGVFLTEHPGAVGRAARWVRDELRERLGRWRFFDVASAMPLRVSGTDEGYIASIDAFKAWERDRRQDLEDWIFKNYQNSGCCVGSSGVELEDGLVGSQVESSNGRLAYRRKPAQWQYAFREHCGGGWFMGAHAAVSNEYGWCVSDYIHIGNKLYNLNGEQKSELLVTDEWCRRGPPQELIDWVRANNLTFGPGAISEFDVDVDALKDVFRMKGQIHHGSNYTSRDNRPYGLKRIGGHAQTAFGGAWDAKTLEFFNVRGARFTETDFPVVCHQTWGSGWSGEVSDYYWPEWWGKKPEGAWIVGASDFLLYNCRDAYVYLPMMNGIDKSVSPAPADEWPKLDGTLSIEGGVVRGILTATSEDGSTARYVMAPGSDGSVPVRLVL